MMEARNLIGMENDVSEIQYVGLIVTSIMSVMLFWRMICIEEIEKSLQSFFLAVGHALFTLLKMVGFFSGIIWSALIILYLYIKSWSRKKVSGKEWMNCVSVYGVCTLVAFGAFYKYLDAQKVIENVIGWYVGLSILSGITSAAIVFDNNSDVWED